MKLKRLTLHGFKSFADRTEFTFDDGLTGIIGPNGCGKSNVVDAVKWVLGDQRPTSLRGKDMIDVIFNGAQGRSPMGCSEVRLVLERPVVSADDPSTPDTVVDASGDASPGSSEQSEEKIQAPALEKTIEMTVGRRLFRSGESEYLLNGRVVRLKDVKEALLGTGRGLFYVMVVGGAVFLATSVRRPRRQCRRCHQVNRTPAVYCSQCGGRLSSY